MMKGKEDGGKRRRPYQKPRVEQVELRPEEAVLGGCKLLTGAPTAPLNDPASCTFPNACVDDGFS